MNERRATITDIDLERLADDELSRAERNELLRALDASRDGWRRCALAFLEAQALRRELGALAAEAGEHARPGAYAGAPSATRLPFAGWLALAASLLAAFAIGLASPRMWRAGVSPPQSHLAEGGGGDTSGSLERSSSLEPEREPGGAIAAAPPQRPDAPDLDVVTFWTRDERGQRQSLRTRLIDAQELSQRYGVRLPSAAPPELREQFEQQGLRLKTRQRFAPLNTDDGRTLVVPVEDLQVTPITYL